MPQYEIDPGRLTDATRKKLTDVAGERVFTAEGRVLLRAEKKLPRAAGVRAVDDAAFEEALAAARDPQRPGRPVVAGASRLEASRQWSVSARSPRKARIHWVAAGGDAQALGVALGEGRGDRVEVVRPVPVEAVRVVTLQARPDLTPGEEMRVSVVLTSASERPWLERGPEPAEPNAWSTLAFDFSDVDERRLARADRLVIVLHTDADEGGCLLRDVALRG